MKGTDMTKHLHKDLGLTFAELGALLGTRELLRRKALRPLLGGYDTGDHVFNMEVTCRPNGECGSVACIGGTMGQIMGMKADQAHAYTYDAEGGLYDLFFPRELPDGSDWRTITPAQAVKAIDNFLKYGEPRWRKVVGLDKPKAKAKKLPKAYALIKAAKKPAKRARY